MEHTEARELLELAAVEPDGFDRLAAGDTAEARALAGHLAGCDECTVELERLRRSSAVIRDAVRTAPPPDLRERTLAFVAAVGRDRSVPAMAAPIGAGAVPSLPVPPEPIDFDDARRRRSGAIGRVAGWAVAIAAAVVLALVASQLLIVGPRDQTIADQTEDVAAIAKAAAWSLAIQGRPDAERVALSSPAGDESVSGTLVYSPATDHLVVLAEGLQPPPSGTVYRCWVESGGERKPVGQMFFAGDIAYWVGEVPAAASLPEDAVFGVSPTPAGDPTDLSADPVLSSDAG
jgi:Anti-sigma-K factor rskA, C-terminal